MITIKHNFDETKFMWLWARYVKSGNLEKHCVNSIPGTYSKKFSGSSNKDLLKQPLLEMNEVPEGSYKAIYFCGVLKKGYLHKDPLKNNYRHNVHFAVIPEEDASDVWDFENWHVEISGGRLERIPATYELKEKFFTEEPYTSHYYTCRIFRWMVGHFYPNELIKTDFDKNEISKGFAYAEKAYMAEVNNDGVYGGYWTSLSKVLKEKTGFVAITDQKFKTEVIKNNLFNRTEFAANIYEAAKSNMLISIENNTMFKIGIEEYLESIYPYQDRHFISPK